MKVYLESLQDWVDFVIGQQIIAHKKPLKDYCKCILVSTIEIISEDSEMVIIEKKY